jgi:hypothetical protein
MPVNLHLDTNFPITSPPTPIPDTKLYQEKTLSDGRKVWISYPQADKLAFIIPISKYVYAKGVDPKLSVSDFVAKFVAHVIEPPLMLAEVLGQSQFTVEKKLWKSTTLVFGKRDARVHFSYVKDKTLGVSIRVHMNPRKIGLMGFNDLRKFLAEVFDLPALRKFARVKELDVAIDVVGLTVGDIVAHHKKQAMRTYYVGKGGQLETVYMHKKPASTDFPEDPHGIEKPKLPKKRVGLVLVSVYDRVRYGERLGKDPPFGKAPVTRIELTKYPFKKTQLEDLLGCKDLLSDLRAGYVGSQKVPVSSFTWRRYHVARRTMTSADAAGLLGIPAKAIPKLEKGMKVNMPDLVTPAATWAGWHEGLTQTGLVQLLATEELVPD